MEYIVEIYDNHVVSDANRVLTFSTDEFFIDHKSKLLRTPVHTINNFKNCTWKQVSDRLVVITVEV